MNKNEKQENKENKRAAAIVYAQKLNSLFNKGLIGYDTIREKRLSFKNLLNIQKKINSGNANINKAEYNKLLKETNLSRLSIKKMIESDNIIKFNNINVPSSIKNNGRYNKISNLTIFKPEQYSMDNKSKYTIRDIYQKIYFILISDYVLPENKEQRKYIFNINLSLLTHEQKSKLCLLILNKITKKYFTEYVESNSSENKKKVVDTVVFLMHILGEMSYKYFQTLKFVKDLLKSYAETFNGETKEKYLFSIDEYIFSIKSLYQESIKENSNYAKSNEGEYIKNMIKKKEDYCKKRKEDLEKSLKYIQLRLNYLRVSKKNDENSKKEKEKLEKDITNYQKEIKFLNESYRKEFFSAGIIFNTKG